MNQRKMQDPGDISSRYEQNSIRKGQQKKQRRREGMGKITSVVRQIVKKL